MMKTVEAYERISILCVKRSITIGEVAAELDVSQSYFCDLMYRRRSVSTQMQTRITTLLSWRARTWSDIFEVTTYTNTAAPI